MIDIRPHQGYRKQELVDCGIDSVFLVDPANPKGRLIGFAGRERDAALQLIVEVSDATAAEARRALDERDYGRDDEHIVPAEQRRTEVPPTIVEDEDDE